MKSLILLRCVPLLACLMMPVTEAHAVLVEGTDPTELDYNVVIIEGEGEIPPAISIIRFNEADIPASTATHGVPEPATFLLAASAAAGLYVLGYRRKARGEA